MVPQVPVGAGGCRGVAVFEIIPGICAIVSVYQLDWFIVLCPVLVAVIHAFRRGRGAHLYDKASNTMAILPKPVRKTSQSRANGSFVGGATYEITTGAGTTSVRAMGRLCGVQRRLQ